MGRLVHVESWLIDPHRSLILHGCAHRTKPAVAEVVARNPTQTYTNGRRTYSAIILPPIARPPKARDEMNHQAHQAAEDDPTPRIHRCELTIPDLGFYHRSRAVATEETATKAYQVLLYHSHRLTVNMNRIYPHQPTSVSIVGKYVHLSSTAITRLYQRLCLEQCNALPPGGAELDLNN